MTGRVREADTVARATEGDLHDGLYARCLDIIHSTDPRSIVAAAARLNDDWTRERITIDHETPVAPITMPGMPAGMRFVPPKEVPSRSVATPEGRLHLIHAIAHIEYNAIHLALDACYRFRGLPREYYADWLRVAAEEARHFTLLAGYLAHRGARYGDYPVHAGLWSMAERTAGDVLERMALVPRVMEARGLDVTPGMRERFAQAGDDEAVAALTIILDDEIGHVAIGNRWFRWLCAKRGLDPATAFEGIVRKHRAPQPRRGMNRAARLAAGFTEVELDAMERGG